MLRNNIMDPVQRRLRLDRLCNRTRDNSSNFLAFVAPSRHRPMSSRAREPSTVEIPIAACRFASTSPLDLDALPPFRRHRSYSRFHSANSSNSPASFHRPQGTRASSSLSQSIQPSETDGGCDAHDANDAITDGLNGAQREATLRPRYSITRVVAGPGAGKTRVLTRRIAHLLLTGGGGAAAGAGPDGGEEGILAVTFTKKAALEMEHRLVELLSSACAAVAPRPSSGLPPAGISTGDEYDEYDEMGGSVVTEEGEYVEHGSADPRDGRDASGEDAAARLTKRTTVGTFHSVCSRILRRFGRELGELPSVRNSLGVPSGSGATVVQGDASDDGGGSTVGSGGNSRPLIETLDGSFNILDQSDQLRLLKELLQKHNIQLKSTSDSGGPANNDIRPITVLNAISLLNNRDAMLLTSSVDAREGDDAISNKVGRRVRRIAAEIQRPFQRAKYARNAVDFDDLILLTRELLLSHAHVREALHRRYRHVLVDEFQDTSKVQLDLVRLLTTDSLFVVGDGDQSIYSWRGASPESMADLEEAFHGRSSGWGGLLNDCDHFVNGDADLTGYLARIGGGSYGTAATQRGASGPSSLELKSVYLMENYRSTSNIVKAAQRIISTNKDSDGSTSPQDSIRRDMKPMRGTGPSPRVLACKDAKSEASFVVKTINSMVDSGDLAPTSTVALIYRTNAQSRLLEEACVEHNLRYVVRGNSGTFYKRAEIQDTLSFLKLMYNPRDRSAWARAVKAPIRGIGPTSLDEFFQYCDAIADQYVERTNSRDGVPSPLDVLMSLTGMAKNAQNDADEVPTPRDYMSTRSMNRFIPFATSLSSLRNKAEVQGVPDFLLSVIDDLGLKGHLDSISKTKDEYEDRLANVMELVRAAERYKDDGPCIVSTISNDEENLGIGETPLGNFLDDVALIADLATEEEAHGTDHEQSRIVANLMTIHSSKGLEFDAVFLVGNEDGTLPTQKAISEGEGSTELSEERRLCYVAMTRAKTHLVLTWRREVSYFAGQSLRTKDANRSRFLDMLVSKKKGVNSKKSLLDSTANARINSASSRKGALSSMTKRELHIEANRYLANNVNEGTTKKKAIRKKTSDQDTQADRLLSSQGMINRKVITNVNRVDDGSQSSWDEWEPSTKKKPIGETPSIKLDDSSFAVGREDRRQVMASRNSEKKSVKNKNSRADATLYKSRSTKSPVASKSHIHKRKIDQPRSPGRPSSHRGSNGATSAGGDAPGQIDSTIFFPVGSSVKHHLHGRGKVLSPPTEDKEFADKMLVRVDFYEDNVQWDLPMDTVMHTYD